MCRTILYRLSATVLLVFAGIAVIAAAPEALPAPWASVVEGKGTHEDTTTVVSHARSLLASDRPWRAALLLRDHLDTEPDAPVEQRILAARAEAGWGGWANVLELLEGLPDLEEYQDGTALYLLGRARDENGDAQGAVEAYRRYLSLPESAADPGTQSSAGLRLGLALVRAGDRAAGRELLQTIGKDLGSASTWIDLLKADALAQTGDTAAVRLLVAGHHTGQPGLRAWRARVEAAWQAEDYAAARALANQARHWARTETTRAEFLVSAARAALVMGDTAPALAALRGAIERAPASRYAGEAADLLYDGPLSPADHLAISRVYRAQGLHGESIDGYEYWLDSGSGTAAQREDVLLEYAEALMRTGREAEVEDALLPIRDRRSARLLLARTHAQTGDTESAIGLYLGVANQYAGTGAGAMALFLAANAAHESGQEAGARELYQGLVDRYPGHDRMGHAMMRMAGMAFAAGDYAEAGSIWDEYLAEYPSGRRATEATYWAARARAELDDMAGAEVLFRQIRRQEPDSYYAVLAAARLNEPFWPIPLAECTPWCPNSQRKVDAWMKGIDLLRAAGFAGEASAQADQIIAGAGNNRSDMYALAEALVERGYSQRAIRIGLRLQGNQTPSARLLRILYPFPFRTLISAEAEYRGLDPFIAAALIRQESMFEQQATSPAGARGLMQIMPATGRALAENLGFEYWHANVLYHPEINVHMGTTYLAHHLDRYAGALPSVFSAYNAGRHRVDVWSRLPEYGDDELFTERIPFRETRNYVKILTRNIAMYRGLYGDVN